MLQELVKELYFQQTTTQHQTRNSWELCGNDTQRQWLHVGIIRGTWKYWYLGPTWFNWSRVTMGPPWWSSGKASACQRRGHWFDPWKIPGFRKIPYASQQLTPCATTTEPSGQNYWSPHTPQSLCTLESVLYKRSHGNEKPAYLNED